MFLCSQNNNSNPTPTGVESSHSFWSFFGFDFLSQPSEFRSHIRGLIYVGISGVNTYHLHNFFFANQGFFGNSFAFFLERICLTNLLGYSLGIILLLLFRARFLSSITLDNFCERCEDISPYLILLYCFLVPIAAFFGESWINLVLSETLWISLNSLALFCYFSRVKDSGEDLKERMIYFQDRVIQSYAFSFGIGLTSFGNFTQILIYLCSFLVSNPEGPLLHVVSPLFYSFFVFYFLIYRNIPLFFIPFRAPSFSNTVLWFLGYSFLLFLSLALFNPLLIILVSLVAFSAHQACTWGVVFIGPGSERRESVGGATSSFLEEPTPLFRGFGRFPDLENSFTPRQVTLYFIFFLTQFFFLLLVQMGPAVIKYGTSGIPSLFLQSLEVFFIPLFLITRRFLPNEISYSGLLICALGATFMIVLTPLLMVELWVSYGSLNLFRYAIVRLTADFLLLYLFPVVSTSIFTRGEDKESSIEGQKDSRDLIYTFSILDLGYLSIYLLLISYYFLSGYPDIGSQEDVFHELIYQHFLTFVGGFFFMLFLGIWVLEGFLSSRGKLLNEERGATRIAICWGLSLALLALWGVFHTYFYGPELFWELLRRANFFDSFR